MGVIPADPGGGSDMAIVRDRHVPLTEDRKRELLLLCIEMLCDERGVDFGQIDVDVPNDGLFSTFRALVNTRQPLPAKEGLLAAQDELLRGLIAEKGITSLCDVAPSPVDPRIRLWRGDITTLATDAIVNAANSQMLGCWVPGHYCIDNAIHTFAGIQLRIECARIMEAQGHGEPTGAAKITRAWNLPSRHVIHTVGPIANGQPTDTHRAQLASCYRSCLDLTAREGLSSVAFCSISTGVFGFPRDEAAQIAVRTVRTWLDGRDGSVDVVFNVFSEGDEDVYRPLLGLV